MTIFSDIMSALRSLINRYLVRKISQAYWFNDMAVDANYWTSGGDAGGVCRPDAYADFPPIFALVTGGGLNDDWYIYSANRGKFFSPWSTGYSKVVWEARVRFGYLADYAVFLGLIKMDVPITGYAEPLVLCAHFFVDTSVGPNIYARSYNAAEEQTDTGVALAVGWNKLRIEWTASTVRFYIDDVLVATHTTQIPNRPCLTEFLVRALVAAIRTVDLEYVDVSVV